jgi:hypothetical protein
MDLPEGSEFDRSERWSDRVRLSQEERAGTGRLGLSITHRNLSSPGTYRSLAERQACVPFHACPGGSMVFRRIRSIDGFVGSEDPVTRSAHPNASRFATAVEI